MNKELFGYDKVLIDYLQKDEKTIPSGSFVIIHRRGRYYWYFNHSKGKNRLVYLCPVDDKGNESSSFVHSIKILKSKLNETPTKVRSTLTDVIDEYILKVREEGYSSRRGVERSLKTTQDIIYHITKFRQYVVQHPIPLKSIEKVDFKDYFFQYVNHLVDSKLSPNTIRIHIVQVRSFFDHLVDPVVGKGVIKSHPITPKMVKSIFIIKKQELIKPNFYSEQTYLELLELCNKKVREVWIEWIKNGVKPPKKDVIYFTSLLQLVYGFRIGEIVNCFPTYKMKVELYNNKDGFSYLDVDGKRDGYFFEIYYKKKQGRVFVDYPIFSWSNKPPDDTPHRVEKDTTYKKLNYSTNLIEVIKTLYSTEIRLISTHKTEVINHFKKVIVEENKFGEKGVNTSHDLRDMCINYLIHTQKKNLVDVSQLTRHDVKTLETYYLHNSKDISRKKSEDLNTKNRLSEVKQRFRDKENGVD